MDVAVSCNNGRMKEKPEKFKVNLRILCLNVDFGFIIKTDEGKI